MNYFTSNTSNLKRDIVKFCYIMTKKCRIVDSNLVLDIVYGILSSQDIKLSNISRSLYENVKLDNTIERLAIRLKDIKDIEIIKQNFRSYIRRMIPEKNIIAIFDDSDIVKVYGKKFEDLDVVIDGSDPKKTLKPGYHVCNACIISKKEKQPIEVYSKIYSTISKEFVSTNSYTKESIEEVIKIVGTNFTGIFDRGYDDAKIFRFLNNKKIKFVIRLKGNRSLLFKGKKKNVKEVASKRKGKYVMTLFRKGKKDQPIYVSYTRANMLNKDKEEFTLVFAYGLGEEPLMLITNIIVNDGNDAIKIVRMYIDRWKIEEIHRSEKTIYHYEDMRVRSLIQLNNLNFLFMLTMSFICLQIEQMDTKLLSITILIESKSLNDDLTVRISQYARGIKAILPHSQCGIRNFRKKTIQNTETLKIEEEIKRDYEQLSFFD